MRFLSDGSIDPINKQKVIKDKNMRRIFCEIAANGDASRASIARKLKLTPSTVSLLVDEMIGQRLILESSVMDMGAIGRKPMQVSVNPAGMKIPVLSFQKEGLRYTLVDCALNTIESRFERYAEAKNAPAVDDYRIMETGEIMEMIRRLLDRSLIYDNWDSTPVLCITMPGTFDWEKETFSSTVTNQRGSTEFVHEVRKMLRNLPVLVGECTRMRGYAEYLANSGTDRDTLFIEIGEGIGSSIFLNGKCFEGATGLAGEIGHITVNPFGPKCLCGNRGCLEKYAGINVLLEQARRAKGEDITWDALCADYRRKDETIVQIIREAARYILASISNMICALNVRKVIIGGDAVKLGDGFIEEILSLEQELGYRKGLGKVTIRFAQLDKESEVAGIARLYQNQYHRYAR